MSELFGFLNVPSPTAMIVLLVIAVLLFGQNLPEVARSMGKYFSDFRRGMKKIEDEIRSITADVTSDSPTRSTTHRALPETFTKFETDRDDRDEPTAPKFEPPPE
jgi:sec-independent protein translocase protein TatA